MEVKANVQKKEFDWFNSEASTQPPVAEAAQPQAEQEVQPQNLVEAKEFTWFNDPTNIAEEMPNLEHITSYGNAALFRTPDGRVTAFDMDTKTSTQDPEIIAQIKQGADMKDLVRKEESRMLVGQDREGMFRGQAAKYIESTPFVGSYFDELGQMVGSESMQDIPRLSQAYSDVYPEMSTVTGLASGLVGGAGILTPASQTKPAKKIYETIKNLPFLQKYLGLGLTGAGVAGTEGAIYGYGEEGRASNALQKGYEQAALGGAFNIVFPLAGQLGGKAYKAFKENAAKQGSYENIANELGVEKGAAKILKDSLDSGASLESMLQNIQKAGDNGMIADADDTLMKLADHLASLDVVAAKTITQAVEGRAQQVSSEFSRQADQAITPMKSIEFEGQQINADFADYAKDIMQGTAKQRGEAYDQFYNTPINYASPEGFGIEEAINRIPARFLQRGINRGNEMMQTEAKYADTKQVMANISDDGKVEFVDMPNPIQLDYMKRGIGEIAYPNKMGMQSQAEVDDMLKAREYYKLLNDAIGKVSPSYRKATELGGDAIMQRKSLLSGTQVFDPKVSPRDLSKDLSGMSKTQRDIAKYGVRIEIDDIINKARANMTTTDTDVKALLQILNKVSDKNTKNKMKMLIGSEKSESLYKELEKVETAMALRKSVAQNSKTAERLSTAEAFDEVTKPTAAEFATRGDPRAIPALKDQMLGSASDLEGVKKRQVVRQLATLITRARGTEAQDELKTLYNAIIKNNATNQQYQDIANYLMDSVKVPTAVIAIDKAQDEE